MLGELYLCASALDEPDLPVRFTAAAQAGYCGLGLRPGHYEKARAAGLTDSDIRAMLSAHGLELVEIGFVAGWWENGERAARVRQHEESMYRLAGTFGARHLVVIGGPLDDGLDAAAESFACVCDRAAVHGLRVGLEFLPWTATSDAATAWQIVQRAGRDNGGLILDTWHLRRGHSTEHSLRTIPPDRIVAVQVSDGRYQVVDGDLDDTFHRRLLPGQGEFELAPLLHLLQTLGVTAPIGTEVLNDALRALAPAESARLALRATRSVLPPH
jgi:sugar phosphate isomerase/epimerase